MPPETTFPDSTKYEVKPAVDEDDDFDFVSDEDDDDDVSIPELTSSNHYQLLSQVNGVNGQIHEPVNPPEDYPNVMHRVQMEFVFFNSDDELETNDNDENNSEDIPIQNNNNIEDIKNLSQVSNSPCDNSLEIKVENNSDSTNKLPNEHEVNSKDANLNEDKIKEIKNLMSSFKLPVENYPKWTKDIPEDQWKNYLKQKLNKEDSETSK